MRTWALCLILLLATAGSAVAVFRPAEVTGDLDGDGDAETARTVDPDGRGERTRVQIADDCPGGGTTDRRVSGTEEDLAFLKLYAADTRPGREVFIDLRSGASGRVGQARLVAWRPRADGCPRPRQLFRYDSDRPHRPPRGASENSSFAVFVRNLTGRYRGREVILDEFYVTEEIPAGCCPSFKVRRLYRYAAGPDAHVHYRTRVTRLNPR